MKRSYSTTIKITGYLLIGGIIITSVVLQTLFTFLVGCIAWIILITDMIYLEMKAHKRVEVLKHRNSLPEPSGFDQGYSPVDRPAQLSHPEVNIMVETKGV